MDWLAWFLTVIVIVYVSVYGVKMFGMIIRYKKVQDRLSVVDGIVVDYSELEKKKVGNEIINLSYPLYECEISGVKKQLQSLVRYEDVVIGQKVELFYDRETEELWCRRDLPLLKKQVIFRIAMIVLLLSVMITESVLL